MSDRDNGDMESAYDRSCGLMEYGTVIEGIFQRRLNRFLAEVRVDGTICSVHVKNTGRLGELLVPGARVWLEPSDNPARKTAWSLISVWKDWQVVNIDSQVPNRVAYDAFHEGKILPRLTDLRREYVYGHSRFDLFAMQGSKKLLVEVKGVTLNVDGEARFPDAPTERGLKHVRELAEAVSAGYEAYILFVIQMKGIHLFRPNDATMPAFGQALANAQAKGVHILAYDCVVTPGSIRLDAQIPVRLPDISIE